MTNNMWWNDPINFIQHHSQTRSLTWKWSLKFHPSQVKYQVKYMHCTGGSFYILIEFQVESGEHLSALSIIEFLTYVWFVLFVVPVAPFGCYSPQIQWSMLNESINHIQLLEIICYHFGWCGRIMNYAAVIPTNCECVRVEIFFCLKRGR